MLLDPPIRQAQGRLPEDAGMRLHRDGGVEEDVS